MPLNNLSTPLSRWCRYISLDPYSNESKTIEGLNNFAPLRDGFKTFLPTPSYQNIRMLKITPKQDKAFFYKIEILPTPSGVVKKSPPRL